MADKLTKLQVEVLEKGAEGHMIKYEWQWYMQGRVVTRTVNSLRKRGLMDIMAFSGGRGWAQATVENNDEG